MRWLLLPLFCLPLTACAAQGITSSTPVDFLNAMNKDTSSNCLTVTAGPYSVSMAKAGDAGVEVNMTGASCTIKTAPAGAK